MVVCGQPDGEEVSVYWQEIFQHFDFDFDDLYWQEIKIHSKLKSKLALLCHHQYSHHQHHISKTVKSKPEQILSQFVTFT